MQHTVVKHTIRSIMIVLIGMFCFDSLMAQIDLPQEYEYKLSYTEDVISSYRVENIQGLSDIERYQLMGELESSEVTKFCNDRNSTWTHKVFTEKKEGWWTSIDEMLIAPDKIISKTGKEFRVTELNEKQQMQSAQEHSLIDKIKFPELTQIHFDELDKAGIFYFQSSEGDLIIKLNQNVTFLINDEKKYTKETKYYIDQYQNPNSVTRTNYYVALTPPQYLDESGQQMYTDQNPIFLPGKIVTETYIQLQNGECAEEVKTVIRSDLNLMSKNAESLGRSMIADRHSIKISPNPVVSSFRLLGVQDISQLQFSLFDINGRSFDFIQNGIEFDVSHLPSGIYFLEEISSKNSQTFRFVKTK